MKTLCAILILICFYFNGNAQTPDCLLKPIPEALKINAHAIKREETISLEIKSPSRINYKVHRLVTVLDEAAADELVFMEFTDQYISLEDVAIKVFNATGSLLNSYGKKEMVHQLSGEGLVPDGKVHYLKINPTAYPISIQIDYLLKINGLCHYPDYEIQIPGQSTEHAKFTVSIASDIDLRYKLRNNLVAPIISQDGKNKLYQWDFNLLPALKYEEGSISRESRYPKIILAPSKFELEGYEGDMSSWQSFGKWYGDLSKKANDLSPLRQTQLIEMVKRATNEREKVKIIYQYLQKNYRYVSIQLGIGGYKPFAASFVDENKYGDCKALSNYTQACLAAVGIKSYQALINAEYNKEPVDPAFPNNNFNHVIVCVPLNNDSIWLECTSNTNDFGVLGNFTENRNALLITEEGGKLVPTPKSKSSDNSFNCYSSINLEEDGAGKAAVQIQCNGEYKQDMMHYISNEKKDDQKLFLVQYLGFIQPDQFDITQNKTDWQHSTHIEMQLEKIPAFTAGNKIFLHPRIYKIWSMPLPTAEGRTQDFYFQHPFIKIDTTIYKIADDYSIESLPSPKKYSFEYGSFSSNYFYDERKHQITSIARLELTEYKIPVNKFTKANNFFNQVLAEYEEKLVIKKL